MSDRQRRAQATASARGKGNGNSKDMETATFSAVWQKPLKAKENLENCREKTCHLFVCSDMLKFRRKLLAMDVRNWACSP